MSRNKMTNKHQVLSEGLEYKDLEGLLKPTLHVDEFSANMGDDEDVIVVSFFVRDQQAAKDLVAWFEKGYDFVLDSDRSPGEIRPNRFLVYVEIRRKPVAAQQIHELLDDLSTLCEFNPEDWTVHYDNKTIHWNAETFAELVPMSSSAYKAKYESDLNEIREAAGLPTKKIFKVTNDIRDLQNSAGIKLYK